MHQNTPTPALTLESLLAVFREAPSYKEGMCKVIESLITHAPPPELLFRVYEAAYAKEPFPLKAMTAVRNFILGEHVKDETLVAYIPTAGVNKDHDSLLKLQQRVATLEELNEELQTKLQDMTEHYTVMSAQYSKVSQQVEQAASEAFAPVPPAAGCHACAAASAEA